MKFAVFVALALLAHTAFCAFSIGHFEGPPFTVKPTSGKTSVTNSVSNFNSGMYQVEGLGLDNLTNGANVLAYGDFNNDK